MMRLLSLICAFLMHENACVRTPHTEPALVERHVCPPVDTQPHFNLTEYISKRWYVQQQMQVDALPENATDCYSAQYTLRRRPSFVFKYTITVANTAKGEDGSQVGGDICAFVPNAHEPAKLRVAPCFLPKFLAGPYWILAHNEREGYAVVSGGQPTIQTPDGCRTGTGTNNAGLWIFTREIFPSQDVFDEAREIARRKGFDLSVLNTVSHSDCEGVEGYSLVQEEAGVSKRSLSGAVAARRSSACPVVTTQAGFNLTEYISGRWYTQQQMTVEYLPADSNNCVTANYVLKENPEFWGWTITVQNRAKYDNGTLFGGDICAVSADANDPAKLKVAPCFLPTLFGGPYWVLAHNVAEGYAVVSGE